CTKTSSKAGSSTPPRSCEPRSRMPRAWRPCSSRPRGSSRRSRRRRPAPARCPTWAAWRCRPDRPERAALFREPEPGCGVPEDRMPMSSQVSLSGIDAAFLSLETPSTPMNIVGTLVLDPASTGGGYTYERVLRMVEERLPHLAPFRRRLVAVPFGLDHPVWIEDPDLRVRSHIHRVAVPAPGSERILADLVAQIAAQPLDRTRPLWELWVVEGLAEGRVALVLKLHHAVADGVSATQLLLQLLDASPEGVDADGSHE